MSINMGRVPFQPVSSTLVAGAGSAAPIADIDCSGIRVLTVTLAVTVAALNGFEVWARGDSGGAYFQLPISSLNGYGRSDSGTDLTSTPAGVTAFLQIDTFGWAGVELRAKSAGAAAVSLTAGGK